MSVLSENSLPDWATSIFSKKIFEALGADTVRFVGGAVRDSMLNIPVSDIDMATSHSPEIVMKKLSACGLKVIPTGIKHGTVTAVYESEAREITTLRIDQETDGRHATVAYTDNWYADAARRDFTINALYLSADGALFDPFGGAADVQARRVRFIGDAATRIKEDALRILRFYRFSSRYARRIDRAGQTACQNACQQIDGLSAERVRGELLKLLSAKQPDDALRAMTDAGVTARIFHGQHNLAALLRQLVFDRESKIETSPLSRLWILAGEEGSPVKLADTFKLSGTQKKFLMQVAQARAESEGLSDLQVRQMLYRYGVATVLEATQLLCDDAASGRVKVQVSGWQDPQFPVSAKDLMKAGFSAGPALGAALKTLEQQWLDSDFSLSKQDLMKLVL